MKHLNKTTRFLGLRDIHFIERRSEPHETVSANDSLVIPHLHFTRLEANQLLALTPKKSSFSGLIFKRWLLTTAQTPRRARTEEYGTVATYAPGSPCSSTRDWVCFL